MCIETEVAFFKGNYVLYYYYYYYYYYTSISKSFRTAAWSENCEWYSSLPLGAVVSLLCESV
jgi:hypothetical protein